MEMTELERAGLVRRLRYDADRYPFPSVVRDLLGSASLERLHVGRQTPTVEPRSDQDTPAHARFYAAFDRLRPLFDRFVREVVAPRHSEDLCVQAVPTFRVHYPGELAVREFHRDSDYHHQLGIVNYWVPLTPAFATNSIWLETEPGSERFAPVEIDPGSVLRFDAVRLMHGNHPNLTPVTRVSFDFRVMPFRTYRDTGLASVTTGRRLRLGDYYSLVSWTGA